MQSIVLKLQLVFTIKDKSLLEELSFTYAFKYTKVIVNLL